MFLYAENPIIVMQRTKILYIEDEPSLGKIVHVTLEKQGYEVLWEIDGAKVISQFENFTPDIIVLDIMLPNIDGYSLCRTIRGLFPEIPVIFLTAKTETADLVKGFDCGGTDYIRKPFSIEELIARIENQLKLGKHDLTLSAGEAAVNIGQYIFEQARYEIRSEAGTIKLSNREFQVLRMLNANRNGVISRKDLLMTVWGDDSYFNSRILDVYIRKLRNHFLADPSVEIITLKGSGYIFRVP
jgi:DNA-binding response OmpR family regulator